jgi:hypothetical protein
MLLRSRPKNPTSKSNLGPRRFSGLGTRAMVSQLVNFTLYKNKFILVFRVVPKICWPITCYHLLQKNIYTHCTKDASKDSYWIKYIASPKTCKLCVTWSPNSQLSSISNCWASQNGPRHIPIYQCGICLHMGPAYQLYFSPLFHWAPPLSSLFPETAAVAIELPQSLMTALALAHAAPFPHGYPSPWPHHPSPTWLPMPLLTLPNPSWLAAPLAR